MPTRDASAQWSGSLRDGSGSIKLPNADYEGSYSFSSRFEDGSGTNPEELLAAAHAACFSMALSNELSKAGHVPDSVATTAKVHLEQGDGGFSIPKIDLVCEASVPGIEKGEFDTIADGAKQNCPLSKVLAAAEITLDATLNS